MNLPIRFLSCACELPLLLLCMLVIPVSGQPPKEKLYLDPIDLKSLTVTADFALGGVSAGENLAAKFAPKSQGVWEWVLDKPVTALPRGRLIGSVKDREGNVIRVERTFSVGAAPRND